MTIVDRSIQVKYNIRILHFVHYCCLHSKITSDNLREDNWKVKTRNFVTSRNFPVGDSLANVTWLNVRGGLSIDRVGKINGKQKGR